MIALASLDGCLVQEQQAPPEPLLSDEADMLIVPEASDEGTAAVFPCSIEEPAESSARRRRR